MHREASSADFTRALLDRRVKVEPRITFGMIVLNGEPFLRYNLRAIYPHAHQIVVVEGACRSARAAATVDGHSVDGTLDTLRRFQAEEDPDQKVVLVVAADEGFPDGFWPEKDEMSRAYACRATGNFLWQIDVDEFYESEGISRVVSELSGGVDAISFPMLHFWGSPRYLTNGFLMISDRYREVHRLFAWGPGYRYATHRPATVVDERGVDTRAKRWLDADAMERIEVPMYHYALLFPHQVAQKVDYYDAESPERLAQGGGRIPRVRSWETTTFQALHHPFRAHLVSRSLSWLERYTGSHPAQICLMMEDIAAGRLLVQLRPCGDVEELLSSRWYGAATTTLRLCAQFLSTPVGRPLRRGYWYIKGAVRRYSEGSLLDAHFVKRLRVAIKSFR